MANVIADVAGRYDELLELVDKMPDDKLVFVGDLNDRGSQSKQVIEYVMNHPNAVCVQSNHGQMFVDYYENGPNRGNFDPFLFNGGINTLNSYDVDSFSKEEVQKAVPKKHIEWLKNLPYKWEEDGILVSHAAWYPKMSNEDKVWNREEPRHIKDVLQIFGHNSQMGLKYWPNKKDAWAICIDQSASEKLTGYNTKNKKIYEVRYK